MFHVCFEFRRGIFFVRLMGRIDNEGYLESINEIVNDVGINYIVLNIDNVHDLSIESIKNINSYNEEILKKKRKLFLCDNNKFRSRLFDVIPTLSNEIEIFSLI